MERDRPTGHGYVNVVARSLARLPTGPDHPTLSCGGATSVTLLHGGESCQPGRAARPARARRADVLASHPSTVLVTINIGDNDLEACINRDTGAANAHLPAARRGDACARTCRRSPGACAPPRRARTRVIGLVDYDQFLSLWIQGAQGRAAARRSLGIIRHLNQFVSAIYRDAGVEVADASTRFSTEDMTTRRTLPGHGSVPLNVYKICTLTWACSAAPIGHDDHARPAGYYQLGEAILDVLHPRP